MGKKILIVDDEVELVKAVAIRLEANGYTVVTAHDGESGIEEARAEKPDLILLDIKMPKIDGYEACKRLKADSTTKDIPIILFTASSLHNLEDRCRELGVRDFITKPFESKELVIVLKRILEGE